MADKIIKLIRNKYTKQNKIVKLSSNRMQKGLKAVVFGGTGAVGKALVPQLL